MVKKCPNCKRLGDWFDGPYRPFCSRQCKLVDLGKWFNEEHLITSPIAEAAESDTSVPGGSQEDDTESL